MIGLNLFVTAAIRAERFAKRQVEVKRQAIMRMLLSENFPEMVRPAGSIDFAVPVWHSRIAGISGNGQIIFNCE